MRQGYGKVYDYAMLEMKKTITKYEALRKVFPHDTTLFKAEELRCSSVVSGAENINDIMNTVEHAKSKGTEEETAAKVIR